MKEEIKLMPLSIQMFAEEDEGSTANETDIDVDNVETSTDTSEVGETEQVNSVKNSTKEYSERLKRDREKMRSEIEKEFRDKNDGFAKSLGYENWDEFEQANNDRMLDDMGVTDKDGFNKYLERAINTNPAILEAQEIIAKNKQENAERQLESDLKELSTLDPSIKSVSDLFAHPSYDRVYDKVQKGMNLVDAFKLENFDVLTNRTSDAAVAHAMNNINNKGHLGTVSGVASNDVAIPTDVYALYKTFNPTMTDEEIRKHYSNYGG